MLKYERRLRCAFLRFIGKNANRSLIFKRAVFLFVFLSCSALFLWAQQYNPLIVILPSGGSIEENGSINDLNIIRKLIEETISEETKFLTVPPEKTLEYLKQRNIKIEELHNMKYVSQLRAVGADFFMSFELKEEKNHYLLTLHFIDTPMGITYSSRTARFSKSAREIQKGTVGLTREFIFSSKVLNSFIDAMPRSPPLFGVGDIGPAGGIIFYAKPTDSEGWQFLEAAPSDLNTLVHWGNATESGWYPNGAETETRTGSGRANTAILTGSSLIDETKRRNAAELCRSYTQGGYNDWFLPSRDELNLLYHVLAENGKGNFTGLSYWSSTQSSASTAWFQRFEDGRIYDNGQKTLRLSVRPIRMFKASY